ncbi:hypothetical protein D1007_50356 [Hordeum vulgare]|nr:hypothetical protein D1007_50356 [Hordeum vulgare]
MECTLSKDVDLNPVLPWMAAESSEHGRTMIGPGDTIKRPMLKADHSRPLWDYQFGDEKLRLRSEGLLTEELNSVVETLLSGDPGDLPEALGLLYHLDDRTNLIAVLPVFDEQRSCRTRALVQ